MEDTYKPIAESQNAGGPVFWRQWYAFFYVYTRVFSTADSGKDRLTAGWPQEVERVVDRCFEQLSAGHTNENCAVELASALNNADMTLESAPTRPVIDEVFTSPGKEDHL